MIPQVAIKKAAFAAGSVSPQPFPVGIAAILATSNIGTQDQPAGFYRDDLAFTAFGDGRSGIGNSTSGSTLRARAIRTIDS